MSRKILVVEDERDINELVLYNLRKHGYQAEGVHTGTDALRKIQRSKYNLVILDLMLPEVDGLELCKMLKSDKSLSSIPIIMLTARSEEADKVLGLELGADDYVVKPFSVRELMARVKTVLRRSGQIESYPKKIIFAGELEIDPEKYTVKKRENPVPLTSIEFRMLHYLAERPGKVFSRDILLDALWGDDSYVEPRAVDVHMRRLRERIEDDPSEPFYLLTRRGLGYYFNEAVLKK